MHRGGVYFEVTHLVKKHGADAVRPGGERRRKELNGPRMRMRNSGDRSLGGGIDPDDGDRETEFDAEPLSGLCVGCLCFYFEKIREGSIRQVAFDSNERRGRDLPAGLRFLSAGDGRMNEEGCEKEECGDCSRKRDDCSSGAPPATCVPYYLCPGPRRRTLAE
jgi:hypothetical protein